MKLASKGQGLALLATAIAFLALAIDQVALLGIPLGLILVLLQDRRLDQALTTIPGPTRLRQGEVWSMAFEHATQDIEVEFPLGMNPRPIRSHGTTRIVSAVVTTVGATQPFAIRTGRRSPQGYWTQPLQVLVDSIQVDLDAYWVVTGVSRKQNDRDADASANLLALQRDLSPIGVREYQAGDRMRDIDWKTTSRMEGTWVKEREPIRNDVVELILDATPPNRWTRRVPPIQSSCRALLVVAKELLQDGRRVVVTIDDGTTPRHEEVRDGGRVLQVLMDAIGRHPLLPYEPQTPPKVAPRARVQNQDRFLFSQGERSNLVQAYPDAWLVCSLSGAHHYRTYEARKADVRDDLLRWAKQRDQLPSRTVLQRPGDVDGALQMVRRRYA